MLPPSPSGRPTTTEPSEASTPTDGPPPPPPPPPEAPRPWYSRRWVWVTALVAVVLLTAVGATLLVRVPYYAFAPGSLRTTANLVEIAGEETYPPDGSVLLSTVSISSQRLTAWSAFAGWLDPTVTVVEEEELLGGGDRDETRRINLQLMESSKDVATFVALEHLGYDVEIVGTGAVVVQVSEDTPADGALEPGDTIVSVDGEPIEIANQLVDSISSREPGSEVTLGVEPHDEDEVEEMSITLAARDDDPDAAFLGVYPQTRDGAFDFPVDVEIDTGDVGGPSAGLSFTLTVLDLLTPGELTGGETIAATGTIDMEGNVGPIGGVEQKAAAARRDGIGVFLVPAAIPEDELAAARSHAGDEVEIVEVDTLQEALEALEALGGDPLPEEPIAA